MGDGSALPQQPFRAAGFAPPVVDDVEAAFAESQPLLGALPEVLQPAKPAERRRASTLSSALVFGMINGIVGIPTMISFATIIYKVSSASGVALSQTSQVLNP